MSDYEERIPFNLPEIEEEKPMRQVGQSGPSVASNSGPGSDSTRSTRLKSLALMRAKLREAELQKEYELLKARNEVKMAEMALDCDDDEQPTVELDSATKVKGYLQNYNCVNAPIEEVMTVPSCSSKPDLPRVELEYFDGNPRCYWRFLQQFKYYVEARVGDVGQRMLYLLHYCRGQAKEAISECVMLPPTEAYSRALSILKDLFGREHIVARAILEDMFKGLRSNNDNAQSLSRLAISLRNCHIALSQMGYTSDMNSMVTLERVLRTLPVDARRRWARLADDACSKGREVTFEDLCHFVDSEARVARSRFGMLASDDRPKATEPGSRQFDKQNELPRSMAKNVFMSHVPVSQHCILCNGAHSLVRCLKFKNMSVPERWRLAKRKRLCFLCLDRGHHSEKCEEDAKCDEEGCTERHNRLLHQHSTKQKAHIGNCNRTSQELSGICLGVVPVRVNGPRGSVVTYALLDSGSDVSLVEGTLLNEIGLEGEDTELRLSTVNGCSVLRTVSVSLEVNSLSYDQSLTIERAFRVPSLPIEPSVVSPSIVAKQYEHLRQTSYVEITDKRVRLLIGEDVPDAHWPLDRRLGRSKEPYAVKTPLGWVLFGPLKVDAATYKKVHFAQRGSEAIEEELKKLYDTEFNDLESHGLSLSVDDQCAVSMVDKSVVYKNGHYEIALPWKPHARLSNNYSSALSRLRGLFRRFDRDPELYTRYRAGIEDNIRKGYMVPVPQEQLLPGYYPRWYLPHHPVINPRKPDKLRIVLDCAARYNGISLNDCLFQGPDTTSNLVGILLRFRAERVAVAADISEMFMQVKLPEGDRGALRVLWWETDDLTQKPREYEMTAHPFGATSSPFCANYALKRTVKDWGANCIQEVKKAVENNFYVDDCLASLPDARTAAEYVHQLTSVLSLGGFRLRKWMSSDPDVLNKLNVDDLATSLLSIDSSGQRMEKTLGLLWDAGTDVFRFRFVFPERPATRRGILSAVSSLFDPLGFVAPLLLPAKSLLQRLCRKRLNWDDELEEADGTDWKKWLQGMEDLKEVEVPRCIKPNELVDGRPELHVFSDASEVGYGVAAYCRWSIAFDEFECRLLLSKARVAPLKTVTIPRLELNAARLAARVADALKKELNLSFKRVFYWTDSMIVLYYIKNTTSRFSTFVANRISTIRQLCSQDEWNHVPTSDNPADIASRGVYTTKALSSWFTGPSFLKLPESQWPSAKVVEKPEGLELKASVNVTLKVSDNHPSSLLKLIQRQSDWFKLLKLIAWLTRFKHFIIMKIKTDGSSNLNVGTLRPFELKLAEHDVIRLVQQCEYGEVFKKYELAGELSVIRTPKHSLSSLCPVLINGLLCVGGRLDNLEWPHVAKHPCILPAKNHVTDLIVRHFHIANGHIGVTHTLSELRRRYWIVHGLSVVKRVLRGCFICRKNIATPVQQIMAPLPIERIQSGWHPFKFVGCDFFGPITVRVGRRQEKRYGCIFTCLQLRAVHLEMAYSLSTESFISVLMRFVARRGTPDKIICDNGTNFVGAELELKRAISQLSNKQITERLLQWNIEWQFNPPMSSHRGGVWERLIRSIRRILRSTLNEQVINDEKLCTFLAEAERILNGRPIAPFPQGCLDRPALTPNDLLVLNNRMEGVVPPTLSERYSRGWQQVNYLTQVFWKRWTREYVPALQERTKWRTPRRNLEPGDVVLVSTKQLPRGRWPLGVVEKCDLSEDGYVRTVVVRTSEGCFRRDVRKLCLIEGCE